MNTLILNDTLEYRPDLDMSFRSSWEANITRVLNRRKIEFEYERKSFPRWSGNETNPPEIPDGYYIPDFSLPNDIIVEVKGFWDSDSRKKALEFSKHFISYQYCLIDSDMYISIGKLYGSVIPHWENDRSYDTVSPETLQVVGLNFGNRMQTVKTLEIGQALQLVRDKDNQYDGNAILVQTLDGKEVGFVSADWACIYAPKIDIGMTFSASVISIEQKKVNIRVIRTNPDEIIVWDFLR